MNAVAQSERNKPTGANVVRGAASGSSRPAAALTSLGERFTGVAEGPLAAAQGAAFARFAQTGFPGPRSEAWRQFNIATLVQRPLAAAASTQAELSASVAGRISRVSGDAPTLVFVNGVHRPDLDRHVPANITVASVGNGQRSEADAASAIEAAPGAALEAWALNDLSLALAGDMVEITIAGAEGPTELHLVYLAAGAEADSVSAPRVSVALADGASATLVEHIMSDGSERPLALVHTALNLGEGAALTHVGLPRLAHGGISLQRLEARLAGSASLDTFHCPLDDASTRTDCIVRMDEREARMQFAALALARGNQQIDYLMRALHEAPDTHSDQVFKAIATDRAQTVFTTCARVAKDAQQISSEQLARGLLLSEHAQVNTRPQLEIYADDVTCAHGATVGQLDDDALFYLRARGVPMAMARAMLLDAFTEDLLSRLPIEAVAAEARSRAFAFTHGEGEADSGDDS